MAENEHQVRNDPSPTPAPSISSQIHHRRIQVDLTQAQLGLLTNLHRVTIRAAETSIGVAPPTMNSIKRALGCLPARLDATRHIHETLRPVLSAALTKSIASAILAMDDPERETAKADYFELIDAFVDPTAPGRLSRSSTRVLPASFWRFQRQLTRRMTPAEAQSLDAELKKAFPFYPRRGLGGLIPSVPADVMDVAAASVVGEESLAETASASPSHHEEAPLSEVEKILHAELPSEAREDLIRFYVRRRRDLTRQLNDELDMMIHLYEVKLPPFKRRQDEDCAALAQRLSQLRGTFQPRRYGSGYDPNQVDEFFNHTIDAIRRGEDIDQKALADIRFNLVPGGYFEAEVDAVIREMREYLKELQATADKRDDDGDR